MTRIVDGLSKFTEELRSLFCESPPAEMHNIAVDESIIQIQGTLL